MNRKKINILFVTPWLFVGGAERTFIDVMTRLDKTRYAIKLVVLDDAGEKASIWKSELDAADIEVISVARRKRAGSGKLGGLIRALRTMAALYRVFRTERPDIVHLQLFADIYGRIVARVARVPYIVSSENNVNIDEPLWQRFVKRMTNRLVDHFIAISEAVAADAMSRYKLSAADVTTITTGIDTARYDVDPALRSGRTDPFRFGAMGRLAEQKGFSTLIDAAASIKDLNFECVIAGDGPLYDQLEKQIKKRGLNGKVTLIGIQSDTASFFKSLDCFVMPSWWEGLGLTAVEAGASGLPLIVSEVGGLKEIVSDDSLGTLVPPRDSKALARAMEHIISTRSDKIWLERGRRLQQKVRRDFSINAKIAQYEAVYQGLIKRPLSADARPVSVFHIIPQLNVGGAERVAMDIMLNAHAQFSHTLVSLKPVDPAGEDWRRELEKRHIRVIEIGQSHPRDLAALFRLRSLLRQEQPDIVHTHLFGGDLYGRLAARLAGIRRVVSTEHNVNKSETSLHRIVRRLTAPLALNIVAVSKTVAGSAVSTEGAGSDRVSIIYNGIPTGRFRIERPEIFPKPVRIAAVGRLSAQKNHRLLIEALACCVNDFNLDLSCDIAGEGELRSELEALIARLKLGDRVRLVGRDPHIERFLAAHDLFVLSSSWEGMPLALLEAGASGMPIVAADIAPVREIMAMREEGFLFASGSAEGLAAALNECVCDPAHAFEYARRFRNKVCSQFDVSVMVSGYEALYTDIMND